MIERRGPGGVQRYITTNASPGRGDDGDSYGHQSSLDEGSNQRFVVMPGGLNVGPFGFAISFGGDDSDEMDPFQERFLNHQRFLRFNRGRLDGLEGLINMIMRLQTPQEQEQPHLSRNQINRLPLITFKKSADTKPGEEEKCPICITDFKDQEKVRKLPCQHLFHPECIDTWLVQNSHCPICKADLAER